MLILVETKLRESLHQSVDQSVIWPPKSFPETEVSKAILFC